MDPDAEAEMIVVANIKAANNEYLGSQCVAMVEAFGFFSRLIYKRVLFTFFCDEEFLLPCADPDVDLGPDPDGKYNEADEDEEHRVGRQGRHLFPLLVCSALGLKKPSPGANILILFNFQVIFYLFCDFRDGYYCVWIILRSKDNYEVQAKCHLWRQKSPRGCRSSSSSGFLIL